VVVLAVCRRGVEDLVHAGAGAVRGARGTSAHSQMREQGCVSVSVSFFVYAASVAESRGRNGQREQGCDPLTAAVRRGCSAAESGRRACCWGQTGPLACCAVRAGAGAALLSGGGQWMRLVCIDEHTTTEEGQGHSRFSLTQKKSEGKNLHQSTNRATGLVKFIMIVPCRPGNGLNS
jgi:hypothetical protein